VREAAVTGSSQGRTLITFRLYNAARLRPSSLKERRLELVNLDAAQWGKFAKASSIDERFGRRL
jgi:hypothetical protein